MNKKPKCISKHRMKQCVVVIPIYKNPNSDETISLRKCCQVLCNYDICLVCPDGYDTTSFQSLWNEYHISVKEEWFRPSFFKSINGYNRLLLQEQFYLRFSKYEYMLIFQPDAYVFDDELFEWCAKGYDYVGAPIIGNSKDTNFNPEIMRVGNGGFSLRRVRAFLDFFSGKKNVIPLRAIANRINLKDKVYSRWLVWLLMAFGWRNKPKSFSNHWKYNEDDFWSFALNGTNYEMTKPAPREAMEFAFERFPKELFSLLGKLPFGCHAWRKYQYDEFWKDVIYFTSK